MAAPGRKKLNRGKRLNLAKQWVTSYSGNNLIRGYSKWFGVSEVCAILELRMLGVDVADARLEEARRNELVRAATRARRKQERAGDEWLDADETFAFVAGCTPAGAPYGIEQEEADSAWDQALAWRRVMKERWTRTTTCPSRKRASRHRHGP